MGIAIIWLMATLGICTACGPDNGKPTEAQFIDPRLAPTVDLYLNAAPNRGAFDSIVSIAFGEPTHAAAEGQCIESGERRSIVIREPKNGLINHYMQAVILHELGHCAHGLKHNDRSGSLMGASIYFYDDAYWAKHLETELSRAFEVLDVNK